jgi:hypothetical protein
MFATQQPGVQRRVGAGPEVCGQRLLFHALVNELLRVASSCISRAAVTRHTSHVTVTRHTSHVTVTRTCSVSKSQSYVPTMITELEFQKFSVCGVGRCDV